MGQIVDKNRETLAKIFIPVENPWPPFGNRYPDSNPSIHPCFTVNLQSSGIGGGGHVHYLVIDPFIELLLSPCIGVTITVESILVLLVRGRPF